MDAVGDFLARDFDYTLTVVEQRDSGPFNRGKLLNVGFDLHRDSAAYFCFHDVDLLPEGGRCDYSYSPTPTHVAKHLSHFDYRVVHPNLFGGVNLFNRRDFETINGFSNGYPGWGCEDNDLLFRCRQAGLPISRRAGRYQSLWHAPNDPLLTGVRPEADVINDRRFKAVLAGELATSGDGLSDLRYAVREHHALRRGGRLVSVDF